MTTDADLPGRAHLRRFVVFGFSSTHDALVAEVALKRAGVEQRTIPTPRMAGSLCGISLRVPETAEQAAEQALLAAGCEWSARVRLVDR